uniref:Putative uridine phosphorylase n=1 Tax=Haematobia irritans TaxID=7368 RepID=A0A1L8EC81_HAEIR
MPESIPMLKNPHLDSMDSDYLYHININVGNSKSPTDIEKNFGDVKFVCLGGTKSRMFAMAKYLQKILQLDNGEELIDISESGNRYAMFKVGPVLCCSHGVGMSTMSVLLHELLKLVRYAKCKDPIFIRLGTSGGVGVNPGTVVISKDAYNGYLRNEHEVAILGKRVVRPANFDENIAHEILELAKTHCNHDVILGNTMAAECFYEGQGRLDGASCEYRESDKLTFLQQLYEKGVRNIEMEATMFASLTKHVGVRAADVCVTLLNRLNGDQVNLTKEQKEDFEHRPLAIVGEYIKRTLKM